MQHWHGFLYSNETNQNEPKHHYWVQKSGLGAFVSFLARIGSSFRFRPESVPLLQHWHGFLHSNETDQNEPKHHYWVQKSGLGAFVSFLARIGSLFRFRPESVHSMQPGLVFCTVAKLTKTNQNNTIGSKKVDWVRSFRFWRESVVHFVSVPNRCIKCYTGMVFCTVMKLTKTTHNNTIGSKKVDWVRSFRFWCKSVVHFV